MPKSHKEIAKEHDTTLNVIKKMSVKGVDVQDSEAVKFHIKNTRHRSKGTATTPGTPKKKDKVVTLSDYKAQLGVEGITLDAIKAIKEAGLAHKALTAAEKEAGLVLSVQEVEERETRIGSATKAAFDKMGNDLPGACSGLDEIGILEVYEGLKREALTMLADMGSEFWEERK